VFITKRLAEWSGWIGKVKSHLHQILNKLMLFPLRYADEIARIERCIWRAMLKTRLVFRLGGSLKNYDLKQSQ
jgi:hypothetical protein